MSAIRIRNVEPPRDEDDVLIHMGAGATTSVLNQVLRSYDQYSSITTDGEGLFAVSVYAAVDEVTIDQILRAMPQGQYGQATFGAVHRLFALLATSLEVPDMSSEIAALQPVHYDIVLPHKPDLGGRRLADLPERERAALELVLLPIIEEQLLPLFTPRVRKYPGKGRRDET